MVNHGKLRNHTTCGRNNIRDKPKSNIVSPTVFARAVFDWNSKQLSSTNLEQMKLISGMRDDTLEKPYHGIVHLM